MKTVTVPVFVRDRFTWLGYFALAYYAYLQAGLGPLMTFVGAELKLDYTTVGLHLSAFAAGMAFAGATGERVARRLGRWQVYWGAGLGMALGALLLTAAQTPALTIAGSFSMGLIGSYLLVMIQATLSDYHQHNRAIPLTESNIVAVMFAGIAPTMVSIGERLGISWRLAMWLGVGLFGVLAALFGRLPMPAAHEPVQVTTRARLPRVFWAYALVVFLGVSIEWCMIYWGADFLEKAAGFAKTDAASLPSVFFIAMVIGRFSGSRLTRRFRTTPLLLSAILIVAVGFPVFWLLRVPVLNVVGLFVTGLGVANLYPLTLAAASSMGITDSNMASGRISMSSGLAILITPQILGLIADRVGIQNAYGLVAVFVAVALAVMLMANRRR